MLEETAKDLANFTPLLGGIIEDSRVLIRQEMALLRSEVRQDLAKTKLAATYFGIGSGMAFVALAFFAGTLVKALPIFFPTLPEWACYGIVAALFAVIGFAFIFLAKDTLRNLNLVSLTDN